MAMFCYSGCTKVVSLAAYSNDECGIGNAPCRNQHATVWCFVWSEEDRARFAVQTAEFTWFKAEAGRACLRDERNRAAIPC